jgi:hypothetical protein
VSDHEEDGVPRVKIGATADFSGVFSGFYHVAGVDLGQARA